MSDFRIIPAQKMNLQTKSGTRYGFVIRHHPCGIPADHSYYKAGDFVASWATLEEAEAAAYCMGFDPNSGEFPYTKVYEIPCLVPEVSDD